MITLVLPFLIPHASSSGASGAVKFVSDTSWQVYNADPASGSATSLGFAQLVCLTTSIPSPCPIGATIYGHTTGGWTADLSSVQGAHWMWAPDINGTTTPAEFNQFFFSKTFQLNGTKVFGSISISADDFAEVSVNGHVVGNIGSISDYSAAVLAQSSLTAFDLSPFLKTGTNILTVRAENGPFGLCCPSNYAGNPAGVVFGGFFIVSSIHLNPGSGPIGTQVLVQGSGIPSIQVEVTFDDVFLGIASPTNGSFSFTFNVPEAQPGPHLVKTVDPFSKISVIANFTVTRIDTLSINVDVGTLYFPGDTASIYTLATISGAPLNFTTLRLQLTLTRPDGSNVSLTATYIGSGMFRSSYRIPTNGAVGTYAVVARAHVSNVQDASALTTFEVKPTWLSAQGPALTTTAVALTGALAVGVVVWKRGIFRSKID
ncbi:MAG TPA: hypothetical protein VGS11_03815 [Candidatus Bathyarchaeia archaeon]|nr:hypothetical protein [Candidatus Bathyarchaeia archaeon]